jgi:O-methyltransferase
MPNIEASLQDDDSPYLDLLKKCLTASIYDESAWQLVEGPMPMQKGLISSAKRGFVRMLRKRGINLVRLKTFDASLREQGLDWPLFGFTMVGTKRLDNIQRCIKDVLRNQIPGDFVETGVWRGGSCIFVKALFRHYGAGDRVVWCCDSFAGLPTPTSQDLSIDPVSDFSDRTFMVASQDQVALNFKRFGLLDQNVRFVKGWFSETLPTAPIDKIAVLRMDGDLYESTMDALTNLYHKISVGGFVIVDDYRSWPGCRKAVDEFRKQQEITSALQNIDAHAVFWRRDT